MFNSAYYLFALITLTLSLGVIVMVLSRVNCSECKRSRLKYTVVLLAALAAGLEPYFFKQLPGISNMFLILSLLWLLVDGILPFKEHKQVHFYKTPGK